MCSKLTHTQNPTASTKYCTNPQHNTIVLSNGMRWYKNVASRGSAVHSVALLPISARKSCASSARGPSVSTATGTNTWLDERLLYLADFLSD